MTETIWCDYIVVLTYTNGIAFVGAAKVVATSEKEAIKKAREKLGVPDNFWWIATEAIYKFPRKRGM